MKQYTFKEWWKGKVFLDSCSVVRTKGSKIGKKVTLAAFSPRDRNLILSKQKKLFLDSSKTLCKKFIKEFKLRFKNSEVKNTYVELELIDLDHLFNTPTRNGLKFHNRDFIMDQKQVLGLRQYFKLQIVRGKKDFSFVHSPNYKFKTNETISIQAYTHACWLYYTWVKKFADKYFRNSLDDNAESNRLLKKRIPVPVIALKHYYMKKPIYRRNADSIAASYGYTKKFSGEGLYNDYCKYVSKNNRIMLEDNKKSNKIKLKHLDMVLGILPDNCKREATEEYGVLKKLIDKSL